MFSMDQHLAQGTTLVMVVPNVMLGLWRYYKRGGVNVGYAVVLGSSAVAVTYFAAKFAIGLLAPTLRIAFGVFISAVAVYLAFQVWRKRAKQPQANAAASAPEKHPAPGWAVFVGAAGGTLSGLLFVSRGVALAYKLSNDMLKLSFAALLVVSTGMLIVAAR